MYDRWFQFPSHQDWFHLEKRKTSVRLWICVLGLCNIVWRWRARCKGWSTGVDSNMRGPDVPFTWFRVPDAYTLRSKPPPPLIIHVINKDKYVGINNWRNNKNTFVKIGKTTESRNNNPEKMDIDSTFQPLLIILKNTRYYHSVRVIINSNKKTYKFASPRVL